MIVLREYDIVRVAKMIEPARRFDGGEGVRRPPQIGDVATICHVYDPNDPITPVAVEMVDHEGRTLWLADFQSSELVFVERP